MGHEYCGVVEAVGPRVLAADAQDEYERRRG